jgi:hypothetical protein
MFMRVNSKCAHQVRPPLSQGGRGPAVGKHWVTTQDYGVRARYWGPYDDVLCRSA